MGYVFKSLKSVTLLAVGLSLLPAVTKAQHYTQTNLVSDIAGQAPLQDPNLQNAWGLVSSGYVARHGNCDSIVGLFL